MEPSPEPKTLYRFMYENKYKNDLVELISRLDSESPKQVASECILFWNNEHFKSNFTFSNWYINSFRDSEMGLEFNCGEQDIMYRKGLYNLDCNNGNESHKHNMVLMNTIISAKEPGGKKGQKVLGRRLIIDTNKWDNEDVYEVAYKTVYYKFSNEKLKERLLETGNKIMIEASPIDSIWGIGMGPDPNNEDNDDFDYDSMFNKTTLSNTKEAIDKPDKKGEKWGKNILGVTLELVRESLWAEENNKWI